MARAYEPVPTEPLLLRKREVVQLLGISPRSLDRLIARGQLHRVRLGGSVRFRPQDVRELVEQHREKEQVP